MNYVKRFRPDRHRLDLYNRVFMSQASEFHEQYRIKVQAEYQWAKFEHARDKPPPCRKPRKVMRNDSAQNFPETEPAPDMETEMQGLFGVAGADEEDFESNEIWNGTAWVQVQPQ